MKILIYSHDTYGLGNISRMLTVASHLSRTRENLSILLVSGSPMLHAFRIPQQIDYVKLPCVKRTATGEYQSTYLGMDFDEIIRLRSNIILSTALDFRPDVVLVDKKPKGLAGELEPALEMLRRRDEQTRMVLLLRDILDSPEETCAIWQKNDYYGYLDKYYESILVVGEQRIFDVTAEYAFPPTVAEKVHYCGYLQRTPSQRSSADIRKELGIGTMPLVLVTAGGGADGMMLMTNYLQGQQKQHAEQRFYTLMLCGPEISPGERARLDTLVAGCRDVHLHDFTDDIMSYMAASDVVISMGGYNTVCELLTLNKRAIIVPRITPVKEQWIRALCLHELGLATAIHPDELTPEILMQHLEDALLAGDQVSDTCDRVDMCGLQQITMRLLNENVIHPVNADVLTVEAGPLADMCPVPHYALEAK